MMDFGLLKIELEIEKQKTTIIKRLQDTVKRKLVED